MVNDRSRNSEAPESPSSSRSSLQQDIKAGDSAKQTPGEKYYSFRASLPAPATASEDSCHLELTSVLGAGAAHVRGYPAKGHHQPAQGRGGCSLPMKSVSPSSEPVTSFF